MTHPTIERLNSVLRIDPFSGVCHWLVSKGRARAGDRAGRVQKFGYREIMVDGVFIREHHIIYFFVTGDWPTLVDHINGDKADNRFVNLRLVDAATNSRNRTNWVGEKKLLGAHKTPYGKWSACITADAERFHLGVFETEQLAHEAYVNARNLCAEAERAARQNVLQTLSQNLTVFEEIQAERNAA